MSNNDIFNSIFSKYAFYLICIKGGLKFQKVVVIQIAFERGKGCSTTELRCKIITKNNPVKKKSVKRDVLHELGSRTFCSFERVREPRSEEKVTKEEIS